MQRVKHRVWNNQALLSSVLLLPSRFSLPPPLFGSMARSIVCYLHNCLSPPLVMGEVALYQRYRGNTDWWSRYLSGSTTSSISAHRHDKFEATNCNGLINPLWGKWQIVTTYKLHEGHRATRRGVDSGGLSVSIVSLWRHGGRMTRRNFTATAA